VTEIECAKPAVHHVCHYLQQNQHLVQVQVHYEELLVYFDGFSWIVSCSGDWQNADNLCLYLVAQSIDVAAFVYCFLIGFVVAFA
jgi:hypothetical protein